MAVVVGTRDRPALLADSLRAITSGLRAPDRLVDVDSASVDPQVRRVAEDAGAEVVRCERPGLGHARNEGLRRVREDVVAFTDDDCLADAAWLQEVAGALARPDGPCFVTGPVRSDVQVQRRAWLGVSVTGDDAAARPL
ncbi:MAG: glycosyltransferase family 2 protein, partial [Gemmatimonadales bacterium]